MTGFRKPVKNGWNPSSEMRDGELAPFETAFRTPYAVEACHLSEAPGRGTHGEGRCSMLFRGVGPQRFVIALERDRLIKLLIENLLLADHGVNIEFF